MIETNVDKIYHGNDQVALLRQDGQVIWPEYAGHENLVLWYDAMGKTNSDLGRGVLEDLSGNGNHGTLQNFAYTEESGYDDGLVFDGVDDIAIGNNGLAYEESTSFTYEFILDYESTGAVQYLGTFGRHSQVIQVTATGNIAVLYLINIDGNLSQGRFDFLVLNKTKRVSYFSVVFNTNDLSINLFEKGVLLGTGSLNPNMENRANINQIAIGAYIANSGAITCYDLNLKFIRKYSRALTPSEIQQNYLIDKERWNLP